MTRRYPVVKPQAFEAPSRKFRKFVAQFSPTKLARNQQVNHSTVHSWVTKRPHTPCIDTVRRIISQSIACETCLKARVHLDCWDEQRCPGLKGLVPLTCDDIVGKPTATPAVEVRELATKPQKPLARTCKMGHPYTPENTILSTSGGKKRRRCKACWSLRRRTGRRN